MSTEGTPKSLREAIRLALLFSPMNKLEDSLVNAVLDLLAQRFVPLTMQDTVEPEDVLKLFERIKAECKQ